MRSLRSCRAGWWAAFALLLPACAVGSRGTEPVPTPISVSSRSHNRSDVDVYLLCGDRDARWLGVVSSKGAASFEFPAESAHCAAGLNFFLLHRDRERGYWVGPIRPRPGELIELVIEKYAPLSTARVRSGDAPTWSGYLR
jgi:hypothetical protein